MVKRTYLLVNSFEWQLLKPERHGRLQTQGHHQSRYVPAANPGSHTYVYLYIAKTIITYQLTSKYLHVLVLG